MEPSSMRSCGKCTRISSNKNFDCPPRMSDGRIFTDYRSRCDINFLDDGKVLDSYTYRQFLLRNADELIGGMRRTAYMAARCGPCEEPYHQGTMLPELEQDVCDTRTCSRRTLDGTGQGLGRWYSEQSAHNQGFAEFKAREQAELRSSANCCGTKQDYENYYPPGDIVGGAELNRFASIGGGTPLSGGDLIAHR